MLELWTELCVRFTSDTGGRMLRIAVLPSLPVFNPHLSILSLQSSVSHTSHFIEFVYDKSSLRPSPIQSSLRPSLVVSIKLPVNPLNWGLKRKMKRAEADAGENEKLSQTEYLYSLGVRSVSEPTKAKNLVSKLSGRSKETQKYFGAGSGQRSE